MKEADYQRQGKRKLPEPLKILCSFLFQFNRRLAATAVVIDDIEFHRIGKIIDRLQLVGSDITGRCSKKGRNPVDDGSAGMFGGMRFDDMELGIGFTGDPPITHITVIRTIDLADGLLFDGDTL